METKMDNNLIKEAQSLINPSPTTRRDFLKSAAVTSMGVGYVTAAEPVMAQAIKTDFEGIKGEEITFTSQGFSVPAYVARPTKTPKNGLPVVIVASEIFGVHEYIADVARRFAKQGYLAIAPEFFVRAGDPNTLGTMAEILKEIVGKTPDDQVMADIQAAIDWAGKNGGDVKRLGVTGFCWGGRITWLASAKIPQIKAGVAWYGRVVGDKTASNPSHPVDHAAEMKAPVLGLYGAADTGISLESVDLMKQALSAAKNNKAAQASKFEVYPDAPHAFHADYRATYREGPAKDGWVKCLAWFKQQGVV
jgi:carboxymethylenebutenolidase